MKHKLLKTFTIVYLALTFVFAGLNFGYAPRADHATAEFIHFLWEMFENPFKILLILGAVIYGFYLYKKRKPPVLQNRSPILLGFLAAALITHLLLPLIIGTWEVYSVSMPLPWSTAGLQLQSLGENFGRSFVVAYGETTLAMILLAFWGYNLLIGIGSILIGRRLQCSQLCLLHGFMAETMDPALPLVGKKTGLNTFARSKGGKGLFLILRTTFYLVALVLTIFWTITVFNPTFFTSEQLDSWRSIEVVKYMGIDLLSMLTFWVIIGPRAYCQYCPAGTTVGLIARHLGRQQIETNLTHCTNCGACTKLCPMGLDPQSAALAKTPFTSSACVGCGRCVESCPTENLKYSTAFQRYLFNQNTRQ